MSRRHASLSIFAVAGLILALLVVVLPVQALDKDVRDRVLRASVKLMTPYDAEEGAASLCSGTMLNAKGFIVTNFHCVGYPTSGGPEPDLDKLGLEPGDLYNADGLSVVAITDAPRNLPVPSYVARVVAGSSDLDIAVLRIVGFYNSKRKLPATLPVVTMPLADSDSVETLDELFVIGYPGIGGDTVTATEGKISGFIDDDGNGTPDWFKTDVLVNQGNSGGSAINAKGELVGIPTARLSDESGNIIYLVRPINFGVPYIEKALTMGASEVALETGKDVASTVPSGRLMGDITFGTGFDDKRGVTGPATKFASAVPEVHAGVPYASMRDRTAWGYSWQLDGNDITGQKDLRWEFGDKGVLDLYLSGKKGLSDGDYRLQVFAKGKLETEGRFVVGQGSAFGGPEKPKADEDGVLVTGRVIDHDTRRGVEGAAVVFLRPGLTIDDFDADESEAKEDTVLSFGLTDRKGNFTTERPLPRGEVYSALVGARGYERLAEDDALEVTEDDPDVIELDDLELWRE